MYRQLHKRFITFYIYPILSCLILQGEEWLETWFEDGDDKKFAKKTGQCRLNSLVDELMSVIFDQARIRQRNGLSSGERKLTQMDQVRI